MTPSTEPSLLDQPRTGSNLPEFTVSDISRQLKQTVEERFGHIRVRGEIGECKYHSNGHVYLSLRDESNVLAAVIWKGATGRVGLRPEVGMDVVCTGRLTIYAGQSKYQLVIEQMALAGEGALLKLIEDRKKRLTAEGLFAAERKRPLPFLPRCIGVVTSPTGAVIRDILHRVTDRFPCHVVVWPVAVQGPGAAEQITAAITGFNALPPDSPLRPDLLIVARGGGSLEDLMAFNEENVVRAAASSAIPLISAVGHETDTTLIDFAADRRAPTPTAAAEMAVPVRADLLMQSQSLAARLAQGWQRAQEQRRERVTLLARTLGDPRRMLEPLWQRLDDRGERLDGAVTQLVTLRQSRLQVVGSRLPHPREWLRLATQKLSNESRALNAALRQRLSGLNETQRRLNDIMPRFHRALTQQMTVRSQQFSTAATRLAPAYRTYVEARQFYVEKTSRLLISLSPQGVLERGYALVRAPDGSLVTTTARANQQQSVTLIFHDGETEARIGKDKTAGQGRLF